MSSLYLCKLVMRNKDIYIVFVDFIKAFDSPEWTFILTTLKHFGFNESFII